MDKGPGQLTWRHRTLLLILVLVVGLGLVGIPCPADTRDFNHPDSFCITRFDGGTINWRTGTVATVGKAFPSDSRETVVEAVPGEARAAANRQIIELLQQIKINPLMRVGDYAAKNDIILAGLEKTARDAVVKRQIYTSALAVEILVETSMYGGFLQLVLPDEIRQIPKISPQVNPKEASSAVQPAATGLIVDARGLEIEPTLTPIIVSEQGHEVYSSVFISREFAVQNGVSKYVCSMEDALADRRVGGSPLIFKSLRKETRLKTAFVISMSDYQTLEKIPERHRFLAECRVVIVID